MRRRVTVVEDFSLDRVIVLRQGSETVVFGNPLRHEQNIIDVALLLTDEERLYVRAACGFPATGPIDVEAMRRAPSVLRAS